MCFFTFAALTLYDIYIKYSGIKILAFSLAYVVFFLYFNISHFNLLSEVHSCQVYFKFSMNFVIIFLSMNCIISSTNDHS